MGNRGLSVRPSVLPGWDPAAQAEREERANRLKAVIARYEEAQEAQEEAQEVREEDQATATPTAPVLQLWEEGETLLEQYPVGVWYRTPTRQRGQTLYQRVTVVDADGVPVEGGRLKIVQEWDPEVKEGEWVDEVHRAVALRRLYDGKCMTIGHIGNPHRQVRKRRELNMAVMGFLLEDGKKPLEDRLRTRTGIGDAFRAAHGGWAEADVDQAIVWSVEAELTKADFDDHLTVTPEGERWLAEERRRHAEERRMIRPQGYIGDEAHDARVEREERVGRPKPDTTGEAVA